MRYSGFINIFGVGHVRLYLAKERERERERTPPLRIDFRSAIIRSRYRFSGGSQFLARRPSLSSYVPIGIFPWDSVLASLGNKRPYRRRGCAGPY